MAVPTLEEYQIGWICALPVEAAAAQEMFDENFGPPEEQDNLDTNIYTLGRIGRHLVAIACLGGQYGMTSATTVANNMMRTFSKSLRLGLMVGIGGGIPSATHDVRLGDIIVSYPTGTCGGVVQHDMGKVGEGGKLTRTGSLNSPPRLLLAAVNQMRAAAFRENPLYLSNIQQAIQRNARTRRNFSRPDQQHDRLFQTQHRHPSNAATCDGCLTEWEVERDKRDNNEPQLYYGIIASGNSVVKDSETRERLREETGALCFEMEAAGLMQDFPCIVIRGICDYADSHKNKQWQGYAALAAASYAKELLSYVPRGQVSQEKLVTEIYTTISQQLESLNNTADDINQKINTDRLLIAEGAAFNSYANQHEKCLAGTRRELLDQIEQWADSLNGKCIFWLNGMAGTGKSTISQTIAHRLRQKKSLGGSFFFKRGEEDRGNARRFFPTIVLQLVARFPRLRNSVQRAIEDDPYISERALGEQFNKLFLQPLQNADSDQTVTITIVVDALDECETEGEIRAILRLLPQVQTSTSIRIRFFLTSRPELPIRLGFKQITGNHQDMSLHEIPKPIIERDISLYFDYKLSQLRQEHSFPALWPGHNHIKSLVDRAVPLFIAAATLCRFIGEANWNPQRRLEAILTDSSIYISKMASTYMPVLKQLLLGQDEWETQELIEDFRQIVGVIIILATPLSINALSKLLFRKPEDVNYRLCRLHSVLNLPDNLHTPVRILHLSFRDFLLDLRTKQAKESGEFWIDEKAVHKTLIDHCLQIMSHGLRKNICNLSSDGTQRSEIDLQCIERQLPPELRYACRYWGEHLSLCQDPFSELVTALTFLKTHLLHWLEAMSILGLLSEVVGLIIRLQSVAQSKDHPEISGFLYDARRFILKNRQIAEIAPLQLYSSALIFCPARSIIRGLFWSELSKWHQLPVVEESWSAHLQTLEVHSDYVQSVSFSPDGKLLASGSSDRTVKLWDPSTSELHQTLEGHSDWVHSVVFSLDSRLLASSSDDGTIKLWDPITGELYQTLEGHSDSVWSLAFSLDSRLLASGSDDKTIKLWNPSTGELHRTLEGHSDYVRSVAFSPDGKLLASGSNDKTIKLWDPSTGELRQTLEGHFSQIHSVVFSPDDKLLASGSSNRTIKLWDLSTGELHQTLEGHSDYVRSVAFSPDGKLLASGSDDKTIKLWDPITGELHQTLKGHSNYVRSVAFSPDGKLLVSGSNDKTINLWDPSMAELHQTLEGHSNRVRSVAFSPDGKLLASGSDDKTIKLWDPSTAELYHTFKGHSDWVLSVAFSPDGKLLASGSNDRTIKLWDLSTGELHQTLLDHPGWVYPEDHIGLSIQHGQWVCFRDEWVLWLPTEYRQTCSALKGSLLALGHSNGRISLVSFDFLSNDETYCWSEEDKNPFSPAEDAAMIYLLENLGGSRRYLLSGIFGRSRRVVHRATCLCSDIVEADQSQYS